MMVVAARVRAMAAASSATPNSAAAQSMRNATTLIVKCVLRLLRQNLDLTRFGKRCVLQPNTASSGLAGRSIADQLDAAAIESFDQFHQGIDVAAHHAFAGFHALDGGHREVRKLRELALIDAKERPGRA